MNCVRCDHPVSEHTGYGGSCMHRDKHKGPERGGSLCSCPRVLKPRFPKEKDK